MKRLTQFLLKHEYLIWILSLCALLRLPSLLEPYWYGDEGIYLTLGTAIRHGLTLYRDIHDNKPPLIYVMAALTGSVFWFRFFLLAWNSIAIVAFERLSRIILKEENADGITRIAGIEFPIPRFSTLATLLFAITPFFAEGAIANGEIFMIMPVIVGMLLLWRQVAEKSWKLSSAVWSGILFSVAFLIKVPSLFDAFAAGMFFSVTLPFHSDIRQTGLKQHIQAIFRSKYVYIFIGAFLAPILASVVYYSAVGVGKQYIASAFAQNIGYLSSWATGSHQASNVGSSGLKNRAVVFLIATVGLFLFAKKNGKRFTFLLMWFAAALFGALLAERPYPHYLIQVIPPFVLLCVYALHYLANRGKRVIQVSLLSVVSIAVFVFSIWSIKFWYYPLIPYYTNYISFVTKQKSKDDYFAHFDPSLPAMYKVSSLLASETTPDERVFVWGDYPMIYALSRRLPPGRYTSSYHIQDFNGFAETTAAIEATKPPLMIVDTRYPAPYAELAGILSLDYYRVQTIAPFAVYKRIGGD